MKRQAEKQLIKGDDDVEIEEDSPSQGFKKADDSVLATRVIRGLPKRAGPRAPQPNTATATTTTNSSSFSPATSSTSTGTFVLNSSSTSTGSTTSAFPTSSFTGFAANKPTIAGTTDKAPTNFFTPPSSSIPVAPPAKASFGFTSSPSVPAMSPTATNTSKAFAASLSSAASPFGPSPAVPPVPPTSQAASSSSPSDSAALKYYTDLRGLNTSILSAISKAVEEDPFFDIATLLQKYRSFRSQIQEDFDKASKGRGPSHPETLPPASSQAAKVTMPTPPPSFSGFDAFKAPPSSAPSANDAKPNLFEFKPSNGSSSNSSNPFALSKDSKPSNSPFGTSSFSPAPSPSSNSSSASFTFGASSKASTSSSANPFGSFGTKPSTGFTFGASSQPSSTAPKTDFGSSSSPFNFGAQSSTTASSSSLFGKSDNKDTAAESSPFGKAAAKSPIHFGFGNTPPPAPADFTTTKSYTEGGLSAAEDKAPEEGSPERGTPAGETEGGAEAQPALFATNPHDEDGEGEENEETVHSIRSKVLRFDDNKWVSYGIGLLKVKKDKDSQARRLLMRNSSTGNVVLNFRLYAGLKLTQDTDQPNTLKFIGHEGGVSQPYSVKVKTKENAAELKSIVEREIAFVKAKEES